MGERWQARLSPIMCTPYDARDQRTSPHEPCLLVIAGPNHRYPYRVTDVARAWSTARGSILTPHSIKSERGGSSLRVSTGSSLRHRLLPRCACSGQAQDHRRLGLGLPPEQPKDRASASK